MLLRSTFESVIPICMAYTYEHEMAKKAFNMPLNKKMVEDLLRASKTLQRTM